MEHPEHRDNFRERKSIVRYFLLCELSLFYPLLLCDLLCLKYIIKYLKLLILVYLFKCEVYKDELEDVELFELLV